MKDLIELAGFSAIMIAGQFSPGPDMLLLTRTSLQHGAKAGSLTACGIAAGLVIHSGIAIGGGAMLFCSESPWLWCFKTLASLYLLYLAIEILKSPLSTTRHKQRDDSRRFFLRGFFCNLFNPKVALILASISAPFLRPDAGPFRPWILGSIIVVQGVFLWSLWAVMLQSKKIRAFHERRAKIIGIAFATLLIILALMIWRR